MKTFITVVVVMVLCVGGLWIYNAYNVNRELGPNVTLVNGECVVINWEATEEEACSAIAKWLAIKERE